MATLLLLVTGKEDLYEYAAITDKEEETRARYNCGSSHQNDLQQDDSTFNDPPTVISEVQFASD